MVRCDRLSLFTLRESAEVDTKQMRPEDTLASRGVFQCILGVRSFVCLIRIRERH